MKGTCTTGASGFGYVQAVPNASNDVNCVFSSSATYGGLLTNIAGIGVDLQMNLQSPFSDGDFVGAGANGLEQRLVVAALRVRYIGTELNRGGRTVPFTNAGHQTTDLESIGEILSIPGIKTTPVNRDWHTIRLSPMMPWETSYSRYSYPATETGGANTSPSIAIAFNSEPGNAFEYEFVQYHEIIGGKYNQSDTYASSHTPQVLALSHDAGRETATSGNLLKAIKDKAPSVIEELGGAYGFSQGAKAAWNAFKGFAAPAVETAEELAPLLAFA